MHFATGLNSSPEQLLDLQHRGGSARRTRTCQVASPVVSIRLEALSGVAEQGRQLAAAGLEAVDLQWSEGGPARRRRLHWNGNSIEVHVDQQERARAAATWRRTGRRRGRLQRFEAGTTAAGSGARSRRRRCCCRLQPVVAATWGQPERDL